jgi:hypothetical protein
MLDVFVTQIGLNGSGIVSFGSQVKAAGMTEHVRMYWKREVCQSSGPFNNASGRIRSNRCSSLRNKQIGRTWIIPLKLPQRA